jgi:phosphate transport system substrate-binding protein
MFVKSFAWFCFLVVCSISLPVHAEQLEIPGTGACQVILEELALVFNSLNRETAVIIPPSVGSTGGIRLVGSGKAQLGRVARPLNDKEKIYRLEHVVFAKDPVVFAVGHNVGVSNLTVQQLADVYSGRIKNWQEVGGNDHKVRLLIREPDDSSFVIIKNNFSMFRDIKFPEKAKMLYHDYEMVKALNKYSTAIGWLTNSSMKDVTSAEALSIDTIKATQENILGGDYKAVIDYGFVYRPDNLSGLVKEFVDFVFSEKGRQILSDNGIIPVVRQMQ